MASQGQGVKSGSRVLRLYSTSNRILTMNISGANRWVDPSMANYWSAIKTFIWKVVHPFFGMGWDKAQWHGYVLLKGARSLSCCSSHSLRHSVSPSLPALPRLASFAYDRCRPHLVFRDVWCSVNVEEPLSLLFSPPDSSVHEARPAPRPSQWLLTRAGGSELP